TLAQVKFTSHGCARVTLTHSFPTRRSSDLPQKMDGLWWMYCGEGGIYWATSDDLIHWTPGTSDDEPMYLPTPGTFDEALVEIGTSPVLTDDGLLVMLTNGATREIHADGTVD